MHDGAEEQQQVVTALARRCGADLGGLRRQAIAELRQRMTEEREQAPTCVPHHHDAGRGARRILQLATRRYRESSHNERATVHIDMGAAWVMEALADDGSHLRRGMAGVLIQPFEVETEPQRVRVGSGEPAMRDALCRFLRRLSKRKVRFSSADEVNDLARQAADEVSREAANAAHKAIRILKLEEPADDIMKLLGRLKFRLSYSQNQWRHALETAFLSGCIADELGLERQLARRAGLLHDIGKVLTHAHEGGHAVLGAARARAAGEDETVSNAIGAHHFDETPATPYAHIVIAADAMSGARPGARREGPQGHQNRLDHIEDIVRQVCGSRLARVDISQSGRDIRVQTSHAKTQDINGTQLSLTRVADSEVQALANAVSQAVLREVTIPGQVRVSVISETVAQTVL